MVAHQRLFFWTFSIINISKKNQNDCMKKRKKNFIFGTNHYFITYILIPESIRKKEEVNSLTLLLCLNHICILFYIDPNSFHLQKILLLPPKYEIIMFLFYHSNSLFSIAPRKVITLNPLCFFFDGSLSKGIALSTIAIVDALSRS